MGLEAEKVSAGSLRGNRAACACESGMVGCQYGLSAGQAGKMGNRHQSR